MSGSAVGYIIYNPISFQGKQPITNMNTGNEDRIGVNDFQSFVFQAAFQSQDFPMQADAFTDIPLDDFDMTTPVIRSSRGSLALSDDSVSSSLSSSVNAEKSDKPRRDRRAEHNATERARRENLNTKFRLLANALPNLRGCRRPSKSQIIEKALEWLEQSLMNERRCYEAIRNLEQQNKEIKNQLALIVRLRSSSYHHQQPIQQPQQQQQQPTVVVFSTNNSNLQTPLPSPPVSQNNSMIIQQHQQQYRQPSYASGLNWINDQSQYPNLF